MKKIPLYARILIAMLIGVVTGLVAGREAAPLGDLGKVVIQLVKTLATPLLFLAIVDAISHARVKPRAGAALLAIASINTVIAVSLGLLISNVIRPGERVPLLSTVTPGSAAAVTPPKAEKLELIKVVTSYIPASIVEPFAQNAIITLVLLALLVGLALRRVRDADPTGGGETVQKAIAALLKMTEIIMSWIIALIPLAVFGVVARSVGEQGLTPLKSLAIYLATILFGLALYIALVYQAWIVLVARMSLRRFWSGCSEAIVYALGASSSLATLPVTLKCLDRMGVSKTSSRLAACVGTNLNNDGIIMYEAMALLFVAQVHGIDLSLGQQAAAAFACILAGVGIAGIPDAGLITLSLVLTTAGLPVEILPLLLTVDWVLSRARATTNVISDITMAVLLDKVVKPKA